MKEIKLKAKKIKIKKVKILIQLDEDYKNAFLQKCDSERKKMSEKIRDFVRAYVDGRIS